MNKYQHILGKLKVPEGKPTDQAWEELQKKLTTEKPASNIRVLSWKPLLSVAAAAALIVGLVLAWPNKELRSVACTDGKQQLISLPDASTALLNAGSQITFSDDWSDDRSLELQGQAFFEVVKGSKFRVATVSGVVEVLGTSFDVYSRDDNFRVSCRTGRVRVSAGKQTVEIAPGFTAVLENKRLLVGKFDLSEADWRNGEFIFRDTPLNEVFLELGRQFNIRIKAQSHEGRIYTGRFSNKNLQEALQLICLPMGLKYRIENDSSVVIEDAEPVK